MPRKRGKKSHSSCSVNSDDDSQSQKVKSKVCHFKSKIGKSSDSSDCLELPVNDHSLAHNGWLNMLGSFQVMSSSLAHHSHSLSSMESKSSESSKSVKKTGVEDEYTPNQDNDEVYVNVYGLTAINQVIRYTGIGVYHSGVEVYGIEWAYGGFPDSVCSIFQMSKPRDLESLSNINGRFQFVQTVDIGKTHYTPSEVKTIVGAFMCLCWCVALTILLPSIYSYYFTFTNFNNHQKKAVEQNVNLLSPFFIVTVFRLKI